ncbi:MAG TPA: inositol monophosphatase family protein [Gemmatimonadales bacterium]|nr:inositol monophosphatase family protein [Gemmatimonadales bacterium]
MSDSLADPLRVAMAAAREAGVLIRSEFHRPGGPRGHGSHADIDAEAEAVIRRILLDAYPDWAYLGEETGPGGPPDAEHRWVVDPNDGTVSFLRRLRGTAVSIALLVHDDPVLGVVFAPLAPDDRGDLIAWARGEALTRNGHPVARPALQPSLGLRDVVLVSQEAGRSPAANAECTAPARFRTLPSIAYRLALVAVGEGEAGVSLHGPRDWDFAAGHALLRAVGGELVDEAGRPIRYRLGHAESGYAIGGALEVARELAQRPWAAVHYNEDPGPLTRSFRSARPIFRIADPQVLSRTQGALLGQVVGDGLGSQVEFSSARAIRERHPRGLRALEDGGYWNTIAGQPTDDSELALMLARTVVRDGGMSPERVRRSYWGWLESGPFDVGLATEVGLTELPNVESQANGALTRVSPLGIFGWRLRPAELARLAREDADITHPNPVCRDASAVFCIALAHAIRTGEGAEAAHAAALRWARGAEADSDVIATLEAVSAPPADFERQSGWVRTALQNAFHRALTAPSLEQGLVDTVMAGGDTDTNGAIAGALLGAVHGRDAVPAPWRSAVLTARALPGTPRPRPQCLWPVDCDDLAERLLGGPDPR